VLDRKGTTIPSLVHIHPDETVRQAIGVMREFDVSQLAVVKAELPLAFAEVAGSVRERALMEKVFADRSILDRPVGEVMDPPLATIGIGEPVDLVVDRLESASAVLVVDAGHPVGIVTRSDVLDFLSQRLT